MRRRSRNRNVSPSVVSKHTVRTGAGTQTRQNVHPMYPVSEAAGIGQNEL